MFALRLQSVRLTSFHLPYFWSFNMIKQMYSELYFEKFVILEKYN